MSRLTARAGGGEAGRGAALNRMGGREQARVAALRLRGCGGGGWLANGRPQERNRDAGAAESPSAWAAHLTTVGWSVRPRSVTQIS